jgi:LPXTG-motif cell wall-anchored protein
VGPGALNANLSPSGKTIWKLTLLDTAPGSDRENFAVSTRSVSVSRAGGNVSVTYAYAKTGTNEYLSALLTDSANHVLYYGRLKSLPAFQDAGTQSITIPALPAGNYTLKIFNEQYNGDYKTDYASAFQDVALTVSGPTPVPTLSPNIPQTGDKAQPGLWIGLVCLAGAGLAASLMLGRRKRG